MGLEDWRESKREMIVVRRSSSKRAVDLYQVAERLKQTGLG